jgi:hypothetical protein
MLKKLQYYNSHNMLFNSVTSGLYGFVTAISFDLLFTNFIWWIGMLIVCGINVWLNVLGKKLETRIINKNRVDRFKFKNFAKSKKGV